MSLNVKAVFPPKSKTVKETCKEKEIPFLNNRSQEALDLQVVTLHLLSQLSVSREHSEQMWGGCRRNVGAGASSWQIGKCFCFAKHLLFCIQTVQTICFYILFTYCRPFWVLKKLSKWSRIFHSQVGIHTTLWKPDAFKVVSLNPGENRYFLI